MPIDYSEYPPDWHEISSARREWAGQRCEWCGKPNHMHVATAPGGFWFDDEDNVWRSANGDALANVTNGPRRYIAVVLTVAHLNHDKHDCRHENLAALCQSCHLGHDRARHVHNRKYGRGHNGPHQARLEFEEQS